MFFCKHFVKKRKFRDAATKQTKHDQSNGSPKNYLKRNILSSKTSDITS